VVRGNPPQLRLEQHNQIPASRHITLPPRAQQGRNWPVRFHGLSILKLFFKPSALPS